MTKWLRLFFLKKRAAVYIKRLISEWEKHGKLILSIDFDSTLLYHPHFNNLKDVERTRKLVRKAQDIGTYNVIFTASDHNERGTEITWLCHELGIRIDSVNKNPILLPFGKKGSKILYNINLCDRSGLQESLDILEIVIEELKARKYRSHLMLEI